MWYPIHAINLNILQVKGRSDYFLKLEVIKKIQGVIILCATIPLGIVAMCYGRIIGSLISLIWNTYYTKKIINYGYLSQMKDLFPILLHSLIMGVIVGLTVYLLTSLWAKLIVGIIVGIIYYIVGAYLMKFKEMAELIAIVKDRIKK